MAVEPHRVLTLCGLLMHKVEVMRDATHNGFLIRFRHSNDSRLSMRGHALDSLEFNDLYRLAAECQLLGGSNLDLRLLSDEDQHDFRRQVTAVMSKKVSRPR